MRSVSILALAVGAGAFAPSALSRPHCTRCAPTASRRPTSIQTSLRRARGRMAGLRPPPVPELCAHTTTGSGTNDLTMRGATGRPSRPLEAPPHTLPTTARDPPRQEA